MYAPSAVTQFTYKFNKENNTDIEKESVEFLDGSPFVTIDFKNTSVELMLEYTYELAGIQEYLGIKRESLLPLKDYPFPPEQK
ncbi:hypothetical protein GCM10023210_02430 [Chryseobacterium ginsengisoli]|uniref:Uncharacterized protein n=2 Tax=Chryseobacterium ginsengisoli TaxID=363853 RepID=A0ABP9LQP3_9FLAO